VSAANDHKLWAESLPLALRGPNFLLRQPELPFSRGGVPKLASVTDSDLGSAQGANSLPNLGEFILKYRSAMMQSFYDVHESPPLNYKLSHPVASEL
jgi:hypothetical protein